MSVTVTVFKQGDFVCDTGLQKAVSENSRIYTREDVVLSNHPLECGELPETTSLLKIYDPAFGYLWISETQEEFLAQIDVTPTLSGAIFSVDATGNDTDTQVFSYPINAIVQTVEFQGQSFQDDYFVQTGQSITLNPPYAFSGKVVIYYKHA